MDKIVIYPGRFQVFGPHHFAVYKRLCEKFGQQCVYIVTSDVTDALRSPLTFHEKVKYMEQYGVPQNKIICSRQPYKPNLTDFGNKVDHKTALIVCAGEKDAQRFNTDYGHYYVPYMGQLHLYPMATNGYLYIAPNVKLNHAGNEINGTYLRGYLPTCNEVDFKAIMGWYNKDLHEALRNKFNLTESQITKTQLQRIEQYADRLFKEFGIDIEFQDIYKGTHFFQRLNDPRNQTQITADELRNLFRKTSQRYGDKLASTNNGYEAVLKDMETDINMPFIIKFDRVNRELDLVPKTIMRKRDFKTPSPVLNLENYTPVNYTRHIYHPHEIPNFTLWDYFSNIKGLFLGGFDATVKYDGVNLQMCVKNGQTMCSRNKSSVLNPMTREQLSNMFMDKPTAQSAFLKGFDLARKFMFTNIFKIAYNNVKSNYPNTLVYLNFEILDPNNSNVFLYGNNIKIMLHGFKVYDTQGQITATVPFPKIKPLSFNGMIVECSANIKVNPDPDAWNNGFSMLVQQLQKWLLEADVDMDMSLETIRTNKPMEFIDIENFTYLVGNYFISQVTPVKTDADRNNVQRIKEKYSEMCKLSNSFDATTLEKFRKNNAKFTQSGAKFNAIEGLVLNFANGQQIKLTGSFGPLNQILGLIRYKR